MKVYVAGSSKEPHRARDAFDMVRRAGHEVSHDWVGNIRKFGGSILKGWGRSELRREARIREEHVLKSDLLWLLIPETPSQGCWFELGVAHSNGIQVWSSGTAKSLFAALSDLHSPRDEDVLQELREL